MKRLMPFFLLFALVIVSAAPAFSCDSCGCALTRAGENIQNSEGYKPWFFDFTFEQQRWKTQSADDANVQVNEGHDVHDKTHEEFYHFMLGVTPAERFTLLAELPYVVRHTIEVVDPDNLGKIQESDGLGDLNLIGIYKALVKGDDFLGVSGGVKFPTGETKNKDAQGELFEVEMQPGSGSYDYPLGVVYRHAIDPVVLSGNVTYVIRTKGSQEFEYGDLLYATLNAAVTVNPQSKDFRTKIALDTSVRHAQKDTDHGEKVDDSGETSLFMGPGLTIEANDTVSIFGDIQFPVYQTTGGVHQKLDLIWTAGAKVSW